MLLVEDDEPVRALARSDPSAHGYNVLDAQNGGDALFVCEQYTAKIHLLLTDVVMPRMTGKQLADRVAPLRPEMKVLFMSGYTDNTVVHQVLDSGLRFCRSRLRPSLLRKVRQVIDER